MSKSRWTMVPASFWTADPDTRGLSSLAACIYMRAMTESLVGVLQKSPRAMAAAHPPATEADAIAALDELTARTRADGSPLARFWPSTDVFALGGWARNAKGTASAAARRELAAFEPEIIAFAMGMGMGYPPGAWGPKHEHEQKHQQGSAGADPVVAALPLRLLAEEPAPARPKRKPKRDHGVECEAVLARIDHHRVRLGDTPLPPYKRDPRTIRARLNEDGVTVDLVISVVDARAEACERKPSNIDFLDAESPFTRAPEGRGGWPVSLRMLERRAKAPAAERDAAPFGTNPTTGRPYRSESDRVELERLRADGERIVAARKVPRG